MTPVLTLIDDNGETFTFEKDFWLDSYNLNINVSMKNYTFAAGGKNTADGYPMAREITISGILWADSLAELETKKRAFCLACLKGGKLQKSNDTISRYMTVRNASFSISSGDWPYAENIAVTFTAELPFWVDSSETTISGYNPSTGFYFDVDATGSDFIMLPRIEIENTSILGTPHFYIQNDTDGGTAFVYEDDSFINGDTLIIDSALGTVEKNGNNAIEFATSPWFVRLQPTVNTLYYYGLDATVNVIFRKVYI